MADDIAPPADPILGYLKSRQPFGCGKSVLPDGTTRAVERSYGPRYALHGEGASTIDVGGRHVLDLNNNFTTPIHGHGFAPVIEAVATALRDGICCADPTESETALGEILTYRIPAVGRIRFARLALKP